MHFIHRFDRLHMRLADSPQGEAGSGEDQPGPEAGVNGAPIVGTTTAEDHTFLDRLDDLLAAVPGINAKNGAIYADSAVVRKIGSALRHVSLDAVMMRTSPASGPSSGTASPSWRPTPTRTAPRSSRSLRSRAQRQPPPASTRCGTAHRKATRRLPA